MMTLDAATEVELLIESLTLRGFTGPRREGGNLIFERGQYEALVVLHEDRTLTCRWTIIGTSTEVPNFRKMLLDEALERRRREVS